MKDKFLEFAKTPFGTAIAIGLFVLLCVIYIVSKSKFGKKVLFMVKEKVDLIVEKFTEHKEETEKALKEQKEYFEKKLEEKDKEISRLYEFVQNGLECINNKKVQEVVRNYALEQEPIEKEKVAK